MPGTQAAAPVYHLTDQIGNNVGNLLADGTFTNPMDYKPFGQVFAGNTNAPHLTGLHGNGDDGWARD